MDGFLGVVVAIGENAAVKLCLFRRQLVQLGLDAQELVVGQQVLQPGLGVQAARDAGVHLFALLRLRRGLLRQQGCPGQHQQHRSATRTATDSCPFAQAVHSQYEVNRLGWRGTAPVRQTL